MKVEDFGVTIEEHIKELHLVVMLWGICTSLVALLGKAMITHIFSGLQSGVISTIATVTYLFYVKSHYNGLNLFNLTEMFTYHNTPHKLWQWESSESSDVSIKVSSLQKNIVIATTSLFGIGALMTDLLQGRTGGNTLLEIVIVMGVMLVVLTPLVLLYLYSFVKMSLDYRELLLKRIRRVVFNEIVSNEVEGSPAYEDYEKWDRLTKRAMSRNYTDDENAEYASIKEHLEQEIDRYVTILPDAFELLEDKDDKTHKEDSVDTNKDSDKGELDKDTEEVERTEEDTQNESGSHNED